jgi:hypothetical protein
MSGLDPLLRFSRGSPDPAARTMRCMNLLSVAAMSAAVVTGLAGAGVAYEIASGGDPAPGTSTSLTGTADVTKPAKRFAPCKPPAVREGRACVTDVVRTVVLASTGARLATVAGRPSSGDDGLFHDAFDDHGDDGPLHDAFDDHGGDLDDDDDFDDGFDDDGHHSGSDDSGGDDSDDFDDDDFDDADHSGHGGGGDDGELDD